MGWINTLFNREPVIQKSKVVGAQNLANKGFNLYFEHVPTGHKVEFPAFIESFSDAYNSEWSSEQVFGRMDPIATFMHTRRAIAVSWTVPSVNAENAIQNLTDIGKLMSFLYPAYRDKTGATSITMAPLMKMQFGNLIQDSDTGGALLGYVNGFTMDPQIEEGVHMWEPGAGGTRPSLMEGETGRSGGILPGGLGSSGAEYVPKTVRLNCEFTVLHQHPLGWNNKQLRGGANKGFPYGKQRIPAGQASTSGPLTDGQLKSNKEALADRSTLHPKSAAAANIRKALGIGSN